MADADFVPTLPTFAPPPAETPGDAVRRGVTLGVQTNPDDEAYNRFVARSSGLPLGTVRADPQAAERHGFVLGQDWDGLAAHAPKTAAWLSKPANAQVSHDDIGVLGGIEDVVRGAPWAVASMLPRASSVVWSGLRAAGDLSTKYNPGSWMQKWLFGTSLDESLASYAAGQQHAGAQLADKWAPHGRTWVSDQLLSGISNIPLTAAAVVASLATKNPATGAGMLGGFTAAQSYGQARDQGATPDRSLVYAGAQGATETLTERIPIHGLLGDLAANSGFFKTVGKNLLAENVTEQVATHVQDFADWAILNPDRPFSEYLSTRGDAALATAIQTTFAAGLTSGLAHGLHSFVTRHERAAAQAEHADANAEAIKGVMDLAAGSKLRERDPQDFHDFVKSAAEDTPAENVYVNHEKLSQAIIDGGLEPQAQQEAIAVLGPRIDEALRTGADVRIPTAEFATLFADTPVAKSLLDHLKTDPSGMTREEAKLWQEQRGEEVKAEVEKILAEHEQQGVREEQVQTVKQKVLDELNAANRFSPDVNEKYADLSATFYRTMAERIGIDPVALHERFPIRVSAEAMGGAKLDQVTPEQALRTNVPVDLPSDATFHEAVKGTPGAEITPEGLKLNLVRYQKPEQAGAESVRTGVFYLPEGSPNAKHYKGKNGYGGTEKHAGPSLIRRPLFVKGATGGKAPEAAYDLLKGKGALKALEQDIFKTVLRGKPSEESVYSLLEKHGADGHLAYEILRNSKQGNTLRYALQENIIAHAVRDAGYDAVVGYSKARGDGGHFISEVFDTRELTYPEKGHESDIHSAYRQAENPIFYSALERAVEGSKTVKASPEQWLATLAKTPGVKKEELEWTGLPEWLKMQGGPVTRDELLAFVREGGVKVEEVVKGAVDEAQVEEEADRLRQEWIDYLVSRFEPGDDGFDTVAEYETDLEYNTSWAEFVDRAREGLGANDQFEGYTEPGGEDYRELLLTLPDIQGPATHWDEPNVVAHLRFKSRQSADGKPVMFIEEVQSDWHQKGRDQGYQREPDEAEIAAADEARQAAQIALSGAELGVQKLAQELGWQPEDTDHGLRLLRARHFLDQKILDSADLEGLLDDTAKLSPEASATIGRINEVLRALEAAHLRMNEARQAYVNALRPTGIPDAPFKSSWPQLVMKRAIRWAVDNGFEQIAWTTGEQQRDRYDLAERVGPITVAKVGDRYQVHTRENAGIIGSIVDRNLGEHVIDGGAFVGGAAMTPEQIAEVFGKDLGGRMTALADQSEGEVTFDGEDLKIGGEGMLGFYDRNLVNMTNDIIKKYGAKVEPVDIGGMHQDGGRDFGAEMGLLERLISVNQRNAESAAKLGLPTDEYVAGEAEAKARLAEVEAEAAAAEAARPRNPGFTITPELRKVATEGFALFQKERGSYTPATDTITLMKSADLSTYLHESGHFFLEMFDRLASAPGAPQEIVNDFNTLLDWFGVEDKATWDSMTLDQKREAHEKFARGFESYLFTGKAPSLRLQSLFQRFRAWLVAVYQKAANLDVTVSPQVRAVMDRMLASDAEIAEAQAARSMEPLFKDEAASGMTPDQWREYQRQGEEATADAVDELERRSLRDMAWLRNARGREVNRLKRQAAATRAATREQVAREVMAEPVYRAQQFFKRGLIDGEKVDGAHRLSIPEIDALYGDSPAAKSIKDALGYGAYGMLSEKDGMHPEQAAEMFGFTSADHMIRELIAAEPLKERIDGLTEQRLLEQHGDLTDDAAIQDAADKAIHNDARARFIATELAALDKATGKPALLSKAARQFAEATVARLKVRDIKPALYEAAAARAAKASQAALAKGDTITAAAEKRNQLVSTYAAKAAREAQDDVDRAVGYFKKFSRPGVRKNMRGDMLAQIDNILARFDLRTSLSNKAIDANREPLSKWVEAEADRLSAVVPALPAVLTNENFRLHYRNLTVEDLRGVVDGMKQLERLARRENAMYLALKNKSFDDEREALLGRIRQSYPSAFDPVTGNPRGQAPDFVPSYAKALKELGPKFAGEMLSAETMTSKLDGGRIGPAFDSLFSRLSGRSDWKAERLGKIYQGLKPLFDEYSFAEKRAYSRRGHYIPEIGDSVTRENALVVALLAGSEDGRARLMNYGWGPDQIGAITNILDKRDWKLADHIWRLFDEDIWPELDALNQRTRGASPPKVEALPYHTKFGVARGGYFPLKYDTNLDERAHKYDEAQAVRDMLGGSLGMSAKTNQGTSTERLTKVSMRPRVTLGVFAETVQETIHDIAYREAVADTMRMLNDRGVQNAVKNALGTPAYRALVTRVREVAAPPRNPSGFVETWLGGLRRNTIINLMSGVKTGLQNLTGVVPALARVSPGAMASEIARTFTPAFNERMELPYKLSSYMRTRADHFDRDLQAGIDKLTVKGKLMPDMSSFLWLMTQIDKATARVTWNAAYRDGLRLNDNDHDRAVQHADHIVRQTQGSGRDVDLPKIMSGHGGYGQLKRVFTMFHSYMNGQLNQLVLAGAIARQEARTDPVGATARFAAKFLAVVVIPAVLTEMTLGNDAGDDESRGDVMKRYARVVTTYGAGFVPIARDFAGELWAQFDDSAPDYGYKISPLQSAGEGVVRSAKAARHVYEGEGTKADTKALIMGAGYGFGIPGKLISDTVLGTDAWLNGEAGPQAVAMGPPRTASR